MAPGSQRSQIHRVHQLTAWRQDLDVDRTGVGWQVDRAFGNASIDRQRVALQQDVMTNHGRALHGLHGGELRGQRLDGVVELVDARYRVDLRNLTGHLRVVHWIHGILVVQLCNQQFHELVLHGGGAGLPRW